MVLAASPVVGVRQLPAELLPAVPLSNKQPPSFGCGCGSFPTGSKRQEASSSLANEYIGRLLLLLPALVAASG